MSNVDTVTNANTTADAKPESTAPVSPDKGKGKAAKPDDVMDDDDDEEDDEDDEMEEEAEEDEDMDEEEDYQEIDPSAILPPTRRTRGNKVDYTSAEAFEKAGLKPGDDNDEEDEDAA